MKFDAGGSTLNGYLKVETISKHFRTYASTASETLIDVNPW